MQYTRIFFYSWLRMQGMRLMCCSWGVTLGWILKWFLSLVSAAAARLKYNNHIYLSVVMVPEANNELGKLTATSFFLFLINKPHVLVPEQFPLTRCSHFNLAANNLWRLFFPFKVVAEDLFKLLFSISLHWFNAQTRRNRTGRKKKRKEKKRCRQTETRYRVWEHFAF